MKKERLIMIDQAMSFEKTADRYAAQGIDVPEQMITSYAALCSELGAGTALFPVEERYTSAVMRIANEPKQFTARDIKVYAYGDDIHWFHHITFVLTVLDGFVNSVQEHTFRTLAECNERIEAYLANGELRDYTCYMYNTATHTRTNIY
jgi:hypothetical protein